MSTRRFCPRRRLRSEIAQLVTVVVAPVALAMVFPYRALSVSPDISVVPERSRPFCAFIDLDSDSEAEAMSAARTAWHVNSEGVKRLRIEMFADDLPEGTPGPVVTVDQRTRFGHDGAMRYASEALPSDLRAAPPEKLSRQEGESVPQPAFMRDELLKLID